MIVCLQFETVSNAQPQSSTVYLDFQKVLWFLLAYEMGVSQTDNPSLYPLVTNEPDKSVPSPEEQ